MRSDPDPGVFLVPLEDSPRTRLKNIELVGSYEFDATLDLGSVATRRFHALKKLLRFVVDSMIDDELDNIDTWPDINGGVINDCNAVTYASVSNDNIVWSAWAAFMVADLSCRYAKFKTILTSGPPISTSLRNSSA